MASKIVSKLMGNDVDKESAITDFDIDQDDEKEESVDEMKIQTMYKMVDDITVNVDGRIVQKKVLYLTNKQASFFNDTAMQRCIQALDIGEPKFVIKLNPSIGVASQMRIAHEEMIGTSADFQPMLFGSSEIDTMDERAVETSMIIFMRKVIIPLAKQTRAVIIVGGANDCYLSAALANAALAEQARLGNDCPFTVIAFASEFEVHSRAVSLKDKHSLAAQLARGSKSWRKRLSTVSKHLQVCYAHRPLQRCDLTAAAERYIIFEGIDEVEGGKSKLNTSTKSTFESIFLSCITKHLPSIAIQSHHIDLGHAYCAELLARKIPVLFLDTFERAFTFKKPFKSDSLVTKLAKKSDSFPLVSLEKLHEVMHQVENGGLSLGCGTFFISVAEEMLIKKMKCQIEHAVDDNLDASTIAFLHTVLKLGSNISGLFSNETAPLFARVQELEKLEKSNIDPNRTQIPPQLIAKAVSLIQLKVRALEKIAQLKRVEKWLQQNPSSNLIEEATKFRDELKEKCKNIEANGERIADASVNPSSWLPYFDIFNSQNTYSGSIHDLEELKRTIGSIAKIDRLPSNTSLEALRTLQDSWDYSEIYHVIADSYKLASKLTYTIMLTCGVLITILSLLDTSGNIPNFSSNLPVIVLSFLNTAVAAYITFMNPVLRWQHLRIAALSIESNIWLFRTRAGAYRTDKEATDNNADVLLAETIKGIKNDVLEGADVKNTAFFSTARTPNIHGQHATKYGGFGVSDAYFSKLNESMKQSSSSSTETDTENVLHNRIDDDDDATSTSNKNNAMELVALAKNKGNNKRVINIQEILSKTMQINGNDNKTTIDDDYDSHYEPVHPDGYIKFRVVKAMNFYKSRIPKLNRMRNVSQFLLVAGSISSGAVAFFGVSEWAAIVSAFCLAVSALMEFQGTNNKLTRYSSTVHGLQQLIIWWQTIPTIERSNVSNIDKLITTCEDILNREQQSWKSTSQAAKMLANSTKSSKSKNEEV